ncbi:MAG TPA: hypothetical protein VGI60_00260 [Chthoniobacterales bacterium]|jgi:MFS family permease
MGDRRQFSRACARKLHNQNHAAAGAIVAELFAVGTLAIALTPRLTSHRGLLIALALLLPSLLLLLTPELQPSMLALLIGTALAGIATGFGYRCSLQKINEIATEDQRAEIVSTYLIACYCGVSIPVIGVGLVAAATNPLLADSLFAGIIALMAIIALLVEWKISPA